MKLTELLINQRITVQIIWGEQKIEFFSDVISTNDEETHVTPYLHGGSVLELNVTGDKGVICNIFADSPTTKKRVSWKGVELTTVNQDGRSSYCIKTRGFNNIANIDDRRLHERVVVNVNAAVFDGQDETGANVVIRDISDTGLSFYASKYFEARSQQLIVSFSDKIDDRIFDIQVECVVSRTSNEGEKKLIGCKVIRENRNYQIYQLIKRLKSKAGE